jgi:hypothetical protein
MRPKTPKLTREMVIQEWLKGKSRNEIAEECRIGRGTVSAIIDEWNHLMGKELADHYRDFGLVLNNSVLSFADCVAGHRVASSAKNLGIDMKEPEHFLADIYTTCVAKGLEPGKVGEFLEDVVSMSNGLNSISAMYDRLIAMRDEEENLRSSIPLLKEEIELLGAKKAASEELCKASIENYHTTLADLKSYSDTKEELERYGVSIDNVSKSKNTIKWISEAGYDANVIVGTFSDYHFMRSVTYNMRANLSILEKNHSGLEEKNASLEKLLASHTQTLSALEELTRLGIGMKELLIIRSTLTEVAKANGLNDNLAWKKFFRDLETYNAKLGFEKEIQIQRNQLKHLLFLNNNLSDHLGMLVADSFQTKMGQEQKLTVASILDSQPDIGEIVATQMEQRTINKKKENSDTCVRGYTQEVKTGDIAGLDPKVTAKLHSRSISSPTDPGKTRASEQFNLSDTEFEKKRYNAAMTEARRMAWLQTHSE